MNAVSEAKQVLKKYRQEEKMPVDLMKIAKAEKISVMHANFDYTSIFGVIKKNSDGIFIFLNDGEEQKRERLMLAHVLGHYFLHLSAYKEIQFYCDYHYASDYVNHKEVEADQFAHQLLMPETKVKSMAARGCSVEEMEDTFQVPAPATKDRLEQITGKKNDRQNQFAVR
jgi:Zn-dependent peptidase ImmA (M78 family)